ncbi:MAG: methylmalonyl-CoA epimerase [Holophagaceae bacterium]|nr:methylmalonyl-CoA epimerase [Holophagaceae bacterium]
MKLLKISHLGIASPSLQSAMENLDRIFGIKQEHIEEVADQKVRTAFYPIGESTLEYLESTDPEGPIGKFLEKKGPGIHHLAFEVDDVDAAVQELLDKGIQMIDKAPRKGAHGNRIAFIHPKETGGVLIEICQPSEKH